MANDDEPEGSSELESGRMPFLEHLRELRDRVRNAALFFVVAFCVCWYFSDEIFQWLQAPMMDAWDTKTLGDFHVVYTSLTEPFWVGMSIALWAGVFVASPFIFYQLWKFIAPGLYKRERKIAIAFAVLSAVLFLSGALFCYQFVLPRIYDFLLGYSKPGQEAMIAMQGYLDLTRSLMLAFGGVFEMPLLIMFLAMIGMVTHRGLWKFNRWFIVIAFVIGGLLTPPDVASQVMLALPTLGLYNLSIVIAYFITKKREAKQAVLREKERLADEKEREERRAKRERRHAAEQAESSDDDGD